MTPEWLEDGRKVPDDVMYYIRRMAVYAVRVLGQSPEKVAEAYNLDRSYIYRWLKQYDGGGFEALESHMPRGYDTHLWTCPILAALLRDKFGVTVSDTTIKQHLKTMGLTCQKPEYQDVARDEGEIARFLDDKFPRIQRLAERMGADIAFEDKAGVGVMTRHGRTWGMIGETPVIKVSMLRGRVQRAVRRHRRRGNGLFNSGRHGQRGTVYRVSGRINCGQETPPDRAGRPRHLPPFQTGA